MILDWFCVSSYQYVYVVGKGEEEGFAGEVLGQLTRCGFGAEENRHHGCWIVLEASWLVCSMVRGF